MSDWWSAAWLGTPLWRWGLAAAAAALGLALALLLRRFVLRRLHKWTRRTHTPWDDALVGALEGTRTVYLVLIAICAAAQILVLPSNVLHVFQAIVTITVLVMAGSWVNATIRGVLAQWREGQETSARGRTTLVTAAAFVARLVVWSVILLLVLSNLGVEVGALVAGLGVGGVAAALAVQNVLGDTIAAFSLYLDRPFDIGDFVIVGDDMGTVTAVGWRSSRIAALGGQQIVLPNSDIAQSRIHNYGRMQERRVVTQLGVVYASAIDAIRRAPSLLKEAVDEVDGVRFDRAHFKGFGASSLDFEIVWFVLSPDYNVYMDKQQAILLGMLERFRANDLDFAFPSRSIYVAPESVSQVTESISRIAPTKSKTSSESARA
ncbi:MAG: mechanosensitive ion channel family protein [Sandaracinaceae bacterium]